MPLTTIAQPEMEVAADYIDILCRIIDDALLNSCGGQIASSIPEMQERRYKVRELVAQSWDFLSSCMITDLFYSWQMSALHVFQKHHLDNWTTEIQ